MALAVLVAGVLYALIPADVRFGTAMQIAYPLLLAVLLGLLVVGDPGRIARERRWLRTTTGVLIGVITVAVAASPARLVAGILDHAAFSSPGQLLSIGADVWSTNVIAFALWYWHLDSGGPVARARRTGATPAAFRFPEQDIDPVVGSGWYPQFVDYLALSFNTATAFSPTDVSAIRHWSKLAMMAESAISIVLASLVIARAVNVL